MWVDSGLAMGMRGAPRLLIAALVATAALAAAPAASAASYPVSYDFTKGVLAQAASPDSPPPGANDWSCRPSKAHPRPVVLVHGLLANQTDNWQTISPLLANRGYCVFSLTYGTKSNVSTPVYQPGGLTTMEESAQQLAAFVDRVRAATGSSQVDIVGHSEGSLMPDYYVKFLGGARFVRHYVGITTLWHGTNAAGLATIDRIGRAFGLSGPIEQSVSTFCSSCPEFLAGSAFINKLRSGGVAVPGVSYTSIVTRNDELVAPYTSGIEAAPNMTNLVVQKQCPLDQAEHVSMAADPIVAQDVLNALDPAHPAAVPCTVVLPLVGAPTYTGPPR
jgi:triacylglycerol esterase/lipase EstA (alpha/beta hydrolase family)